MKLHYFDNVYNYVDSLPYLTRNGYQWNVFSSIFGNPLAGKYESRHIKLC